ncbi:MAG: hypothetical protein ACE5IK_05610 [Acidobacteriota bacterium]
MFGPLKWKHLILCRRAGLSVLLVATLLLAGPAVAAGGPAVFPWREGRIESFRYSIERAGHKVGEIEQVLYGDKDVHGGRRYRAVVELIRQTQVGEDRSVMGRFTSEVFFGLDSMDFIERLDNFARGDTEGRSHTVRTPSGLKITSESMSSAIGRPPVEQTMPLDGTEPVVDKLALTYFIRTLPHEKGYAFHINTVIPLEKVVDRLAGEVGPEQDLLWHGSSIRVRRIEVASARGTGSYFVAADAQHRLIRFVSRTQEVYDLLPAGEEPDAGSDGSR